MNSKLTRFTAIILLVGLAPQAIADVDWTITNPSSYYSRTIATITCQGTNDSFGGTHEFVAKIQTNPGGVTISEEPGTSSMLQWSATCDRPTEGNWGAAGEDVLRSRVEPAGVGHNVTNQNKPFSLSAL